MTITRPKFIHFPSLFNSCSKPSQAIPHLSTCLQVNNFQSLLNITLLLFCRKTKQNKTQKISGMSPASKFNLYLHLLHILPELRIEVFLFLSRANSCIMLSIAISLDLTSKSVGHKAAASASSGSLSEMLYLRPQPRPSDSESAF